MDYEAWAIGWRDPGDQELVRYQPTIVSDDDTEQRLWRVEKYEGHDLTVQKLWIQGARVPPRIDRDRVGRARDVIGPVLYRSRARATRIAVRRAKSIVRYERRYGLGAEEIGT